jgi:hypothetical protein
MDMDALMKTLLEIKRNLSLAETILGGFGNA